MSMPAIERVIPLVGQLPVSMRDALARRLRELAGLGLIALAGVAAAALMTWSVQDPSLSHATSRAVRNIVGYPGAIGADLLMQILGLGAVMLILPVAVWGWRMLTHRSFDREPLRIACWILCMVTCGGLCELLAAWRRVAAADRNRRRGRRRPGARARGRVRPARRDLSHRARTHPGRHHGRNLPDRLRPRLAAAGGGLTPIEDDDAPFVEDGGRWLGPAGLGVSCRDERESAAVAVADAGLPVAGRQRPGATDVPVRSPGAAARRPRRTVTGAAGRRGLRRRGKRGGRGGRDEAPAARAPRKKAAGARNRR